MISPVNYQRIREADGVFFFYEFAPDCLQNMEWKAFLYEEGDRVRIDSPILALSEEEMDEENIRLKKLHKEKKKKLTNFQKSYLKKEEDYLKKMLDSKQVFMPFSGILSLSVDGYEDFFSLEHLEKLQPGDFYGNIPQENKKMEGIKFLDNRTYYLVCDLNQSLIQENWELEKTYNLQINKELILEGKLNKFVMDEFQRTLLIFELHDHFEKIYQDRFVDLAIILDETPAYFIPRDSLFEEKKNYFVYVLDKNKKAKKQKVDLLDFDFSSQNWLVKREEKAEDALSNFDQIFLRPEKVKEGGAY